MTACAVAHQFGSAPRERPLSSQAQPSLLPAGYGKENILFAIAEASLGRPDDPVRQVVYPAVAGGEQTLRELVVPAGARCR
ncbi:MAG: hypothetical protein M3460_24650 [Actinomycetota bacterium]|nr:hypothetical protein [Actinomycetota bacterium]